MEQQLELLRALAQPTRFRIILLLADAELCSCELGELLGISQAAISQHMSLLRRTGLISERRVGTWVYYQLRRGCLERALTDLSQAVANPRNVQAEASFAWSRLDRLLTERQRNCWRQEGV